MKDTERYRAAQKREMEFLEKTVEADEKKKEA